MPSVLIVQKYTTIKNNHCLADSSRFYSDRKFWLGHFACNVNQAVKVNSEEFKSWSSSSGLHVGCGQCSFLSLELFGLEPNTPYRVHCE